MLYLWVQMRDVDSCDPGGVSDGSGLALYQTLSIECPSSVFFWQVLSFLSFVFVLVFMPSLELLCRCLKKNLSAPRPSEHPPVMGGKMSKRLGGIKGCKYKTSSWHLNRFPDADNIGSTV